MLKYQETIEDIFANLNLSKPYFLKRAAICHCESPINFLPSQRKLKNRKGWTVLLIYSECPPSVKRIDEIVAFPDSMDSSFPRVKKIRNTMVRAEHQVVDLSRVPKKYKFRDIESLGEFIEDWAR